MSIVHHDHFFSNELVSVAIPLVLLGLSQQPWDGGDCRLECGLVSHNFTYVHRQIATHSSRGSGARDDAFRDASH